MLRISAIAAVTIACSLANAVDQPTANHEAATQSVPTGTEPAQGAGEASSPFTVQGLTTLPSPTSSAEAQEKASEAAAVAPALAPVTPFVTYGPSGDPAKDEELQRRVYEIRERERRLLEQPEYRDLLRAQQRLALSSMHPDLAVMLDIPQEQADQLLDLLAEHRIREQAAAIPMAPGPTHPATVQAIIDKAEERRKTNDAEILALLGPSKFQEWKEYDGSLSARFLVQRFQAALPEDARLRPEQLRPLLKAIATEQRRIFEERVRSLPAHQRPDKEWLERQNERQRERMIAANQRIVDASAPILSPRQLEYLESMLQQDLDPQAPRVTSFGQRAPVSPPPSPGPGPQ